jgi:hypothetical protein
LEALDVAVGLAPPDATFHYDYASARWSTALRRFLGFASITTKDAHSQVATDYAQTAGCAMTPTRVTVREPAGPRLTSTTDVLDDTSVKNPPPLPLHATPEAHRRVRGDGHVPDDFDVVRARRLWQRHPHPGAGSLRGRRP